MPTSAAAANRAVLKTTTSARTTDPKEYRHFIVSSFLRRELAQLRNPRVRRGVLFTRPGLRWAAVARQFGAWSVHPAVRWTNARFVAAAHRHGWRVLPYTANDAKTLARLRAIGVDGVFTDFPERARAEAYGLGPE